METVLRDLLAVTLAVIASRIVVDVVGIVRAIRADVRDGKKK